MSVLRSGPPWSGLKVLKKYTVQEIESNTGGISDMISSWHRAAVEHALAKANDGKTDRGPVLKVSKSADQSTVRLVLRSHGSPRTIGADGCSFVTRRESDWVE